MAYEERQAGKTAEAFALVPMDDVEGNRAYALDEIRRAACRNIISAQGDGLLLKAAAIAGTFWREGKDYALPDSTKEEIVLATREKMVKSIIRAYDPLNPYGATALTYGSKAGETEARGKTAEAFAALKRNRSLDEPLQGGASDEDGDRGARTRADTLGDDAFGRMPLRAKVDLLLLKPHLTDREWEVFYEMRYARYMEHADIARHFRWTESRYRWFWRNLKRKLMTLTDHNGRAVRTIA